MTKSKVRARAKKSYLMKPARGLKTLMLLGSGELGKEFAIAAKRMGHRVVAVDRYNDAPAMQVADARETISMLDGDALAEIVQRHRPDAIIPEIEAIRTEKLAEFEAQGIFVAPCAEAARLTMNRDAIRDVAARELKLRCARYAYACSESELVKAAADVGFPCVVKPTMSSSGKGQSVAKSAADVKSSWAYAVAGMRGDKQIVIVEEFIRFESEITLLTIRQLDGSVVFAPPIGHLQERGDYQESWMPARISPTHLKAARAMAKKVVNRLGGAGIFGVEFFLTKSGVIFSELSPRPHDTGMVTLAGGIELNEFELHLRAVLGLPIPKLTASGASASAVILATEPIATGDVDVIGVANALNVPGADVRIFGKPSATKHRRMGVALARGKTLAEARARAKLAASRVQIVSRARAANAMEAR